MRLGLVALCVLLWCAAGPRASAADCDELEELCKVGSRWVRRVNGTLSATAWRTQINLAKYDDLKRLAGQNRLVVSVLLEVNPPLLPSATVAAATTSVALTSSTHLSTTPAPDTLASAHAQLLLTTFDDFLITLAKISAAVTAKNTVVGSGTGCYPATDLAPAAVFPDNIVTVVGTAGYVFRGRIEYSDATIMLDVPQHVVVQDTAPVVMIFDWVHDSTASGFRVELKRNSPKFLPSDDLSDAVQLNDRDELGVDGQMFVSKSATNNACPDLSRAFIDSSPRSQRATFNKQALLTISGKSNPRVAAGRYFVGLSMPTGWKATDVTVRVYKYTTHQDETLVFLTLLPLGLMCLIMPGCYWLTCPSRVSTTFKNWVSLPSKYPPRFADRLRALWWQPEEGSLFSFEPTQNHVFAWITAAVALSWLVVAWQVVFGRWLLMRDTGDRDLCFYNARCYHPLAFWDIPFNNIVSNSGYIIAGILVGVVNARIYHAAWRYFSAEKRKEDKNYPDVPIDYSIQSAIGIGLIAVGLNSSIYHVCPSRAAFQFDTSFMFVVAVLIYVGLHQIGELDKRHWLGHAIPVSLELTRDHVPGHAKQLFKAGRIFTLFVAPLLFLNYLGVYAHDTDHLWFKILYIVLVCLWELRILTIMYSRGAASLDSQGSTWRRHSLKAALAIVMFLIPASLLFGVDPANVFLYPVVGMAIASIVYTTAVRWAWETPFMDRDGAKWYQNPSRVRAVMLVALLAVVSVASALTAGYYFSRSVTDKTKRPALSRNLNVDCEPFLGSVTDSHDLWHSLGSVALFGMMMMVLLLNPPRRENDFSKPSNLIFKRELELTGLQLDVNKRYGRARNATISLMDRVRTLTGGGHHPHPPRAQPDGTPLEPVDGRQELAEEASSSSAMAGGGASPSAEEEESDIHPRNSEANASPVNGKMVELPPRSPGFVQQ